MSALASLTVKNLLFIHLEFSQNGMAGQTIRQIKCAFSLTEFPLTGCVGSDGRFPGVGMATQEHLSPVL
jgi:hypothetical protein